ncbi:MAG TPA: VOC family protein [Steroidobacteraceae bacterium]|nr:VOC family protein [Steroidobacteraceae bacterium]
MTAITLGYVVVESADPAAWRKFAVDTLGLMEGAPGPHGALRLRIDERPFRIEVRAGTRERFVSCGWELAGAAALRACAQSLRAAGVEVRAGTAAEAEARCVREIAFCADPCGNQLELYWGRANDYQPFASPRGLSGFLAGDLGMGHAVLPAPDLETARRFYEHHLGLALTDEMWLQMSPNPQDPKLGIYFLHARSRRHHSLALIGAPAPSGCVHIMLEARTLDDVGFALDRCIASGAHISSSLGKHSNDFMVSFYVRTPGGFDLEFGCAGLQPDWSTWVPTYSLIPDLWGHRWAPAPAEAEPQ